MTRAQNRREHPLSMRFPKADVALIDRAAGLKGRSRTDFVREAAVPAAEEVILAGSPVRMSLEDFQAFEAAIAGPGEAVPELVELFRRRAPWDSVSS